MKMNDSLSSRVIFTTVRLEFASGSVGTGFFFDFPVSGDRFVPVLVTNWHVVEDEQGGWFVLHEQGQDGEILDSRLRVELPECSHRWVRHPSEDLGALPVLPELEALRRAGRNPYLRSFSTGNIPSDKTLQSLFTVEDVTIAGYPFGAWDEVNNFPILRRGVTASAPVVNYNGQPAGLVDIAAFPGCSGSPVLVLNDGVWIDSQGLKAGSTGRLLLLGVLTKSMTEDMDGKIVVKEIPCKLTECASTAIHIHLGLYIKARELSVLGSMLLKQVGA
jgi:hypothetical protein